MNVERWVRSRTPYWDQLEELLKNIASRGIQSLNNDQLRDLGRLYRCASSDLSRARAMKIGGDIPIYLNNLVVKAHNQVYQRRINRWTDLRNYLWITFPTLVQNNVAYICLAFALVAIPFIACYCAVLHDINFAHLEVAKGKPLVSEELWHVVEQHKMWTDQAQDYSPTVSSQIATNNIRVAILAFALGITGGIGTSAVLLLNGISLGATFGVCRIYHLDDRLWAFCSAHGVIELMSIFISGAAGLIIGKALLFPGSYRRQDALRLASRSAFALFAGCIPLLLIAGTIEGFISPRTDLPAAAKFAVSLATFICLFLYLFLPRNVAASKATIPPPNMQSISKHTPDAVVIENPEFNLS
jgi:uncharacterized membrane protein SpoIIM required for sporulation